MRLDTAVVFSLCQPRLACDFSKVHEAIEYIAGQSVWTHSLPRVFKALQPSLMQQFPWGFSDDAKAANSRIEKVADSGVASPTEIMSVIIEEMGKLSLKYGSTHEAREIDDPTSVYKNPLKEAEEMFGDRVILAQAKEESQ